MSDLGRTFIVDKSVARHWRVTLDNPPINVIDEGMYDAFYDLVGEIEAEAALKVVSFESANPDFFIAHYGTSGPRSRFGVPRWIDAATRLANSGVLSIAVIRGRVRGGDSEFALGCDIRFASREKAIFGQPEVGTGLIPGGGALQRLPLLVGRSRTLEIVLGADDFDADTAERYGWINRAIADAELDPFVEAWATRVAQFDRDAITAAKHTLNAHGGLPDIAWFAPSQQAFYQLLAQPHVQTRMRDFLDRGMQQPGDFELNLADQLTQTPAPDDAQLRI